jgi:hypothetical protein
MFSFVHQRYNLDYLLDYRLDHLFDYHHLPNNVS